MTEPKKKATIRRVTIDTEFLRCAIRMRKAQKNYFQTRNSGYLAEAKKAEANFDKELLAIIKDLQQMVNKVEDVIQDGLL